MICETEFSKVKNTTLLGGEVVLKETKLNQVDSETVTLLNDQLRSLVKIECPVLAKYYKIEVSAN